jgi:hypothetical protein
MDLVVVVHPLIDAVERGDSVRDGADPDVVSLERFDERLGHSVGFGALDRREAGFKVQGDRDIREAGDLVGPGRSGGQAHPAAPAIRRK